MLLDLEADLENRKNASLPQNKMHILGIDRMRPYLKKLCKFLDINCEESILQLKPVHVKITLTAFKRLRNDPNTFRRYHYKILNDYEFTEEFK